MAGNLLFWLSRSDEVQGGAKVKGRAYGGRDQLGFLQAASLL
jgi:hypothetical protein